MKKSGILNSKLSELIAQMGHTDKIVICDCGLPIPRDKTIVDLALTENIPRFTETLKVILEELYVEGAILAKEIESNNAELYKQIHLLLPNIKIDKVEHEEFKNIIRSNNNIVFVRTGEASPFANIILISGVTFS